MGVPLIFKCCNPQNIIESDDIKPNESAEEEDHASQYMKIMKDAMDVLKTIGRDVDFVSFIEHLAKGTLPVNNICVSTS